MYQDEYRDSRTTKSTETLFSVVPVGTCTYRHMSDDDVFHMNINTLEKGLVSREYPVFEASKGNNLEFLVQHINSSEEFKAFCAEQKKGGTRTRLYYNTLCQFTVRVPALKEQAQISQCLKKLDTLITLHQRKYEKLVNIKKSMLDKMFPKNGASVPEIRFKGFTDPWEQRKLGDITVELSEYATQELGLPLLTSSRSGLMYQDEYRDSRTTKSTETLFSVVPVGTCTYRHMSDDDVFHMNINTLEKGLVSREYPVFEASKGNNLEFLVQHINSSEEFKAFCAEQKKGGTRTRLYYNTLCQFTVRVPALKEQAQISQCLKKLDTLITLHQRKYEKLVNIKKSMLDKMFPKNGASVPEIRFKGFTDPWEQRKLGEIANFSKGVGYSKNDLCEEGTPIILYGRLYTKYETSIFDVDTFVKEKAGSVYSKGGEVIVPASGETAEDISIASVVVKPGILLGGDLNIVSPTTEYDSAFLALTISSGAAHEYLSSLAQGKSVVHLHNSDIQSVSAKFPTKREQEKIHLIFGKIDTLITLHQRKLEKLQNIKKSCLEKMFV